MAKKTATLVDPRDKIMKHLKDNDRKLPWLVKQMNEAVTYAHMYFVLVKKTRELTDDNRQLINKVLNTNF